MKSTLPSLNADILSQYVKYAKPNSRKTAESWRLRAARSGNQGNPYAPCAAAEGFDGQGRFGDENDANAAQVYRAVSRVLRKNQT